MQDLIIQNHFYTGAHQKVLTLFPTLSSDLQLTLKSIHERSLIALNYPPTTKLHTLLSNQLNGIEDELEMDECNDQETAVVYATVFMLRGEYENAVQCTSHYPKNMECIALVVLSYIFMNRLDMAESEITRVKLWADDATLFQLVEAWTILYSRSEQKLKDMIYVFEEFASVRDASAQMHNGHAVCLMLLKRFGEAEGVLLDAEKNSSDADVQANLIACYSAMGKNVDAQKHVKKLANVNVKHAALKHLAEKSALFDKCSKYYLK